MSQNSVGGISDFRISGQPLMKRNCHNSKTSDDNDMKLGTVIKLDKRNKTTSKKKWWWRHVRKLWRHCLFSNLRPIWSNLKGEFRTHGLHIFWNYICVKFHLHPLAPHNPPQSEPLKRPPRFGWTIHIIDALYRRTKTKQLILITNILKNVTFQSPYRFIY